MLDTHEVISGGLRWCGSLMTTFCWHPIAAPATLHGIRPLQLRIREDGFQGALDRLQVASLLAERLRLHLLHTMLPTSTTARIVSNQLRHGT